MGSQYWIILGSQYWLIMGPILLDNHELPILLFSDGFLILLDSHGFLILLNNHGWRETGVYEGVQRYTRVYGWYEGIHRCMEVYEGIWWYMNVYAGICMDMGVYGVIGETGTGVWRRVNQCLLGSPSFYRPGRYDDNPIYGSTGRIWNARCISFHWLVRVRVRRQKHWACLDAMQLGR